IYCRRLHLSAEQRAAATLHEIDTANDVRGSVGRAGATGATRPQFCLGAIRQVGRTMQFLVYLSVLMVSVSTVLLEIHWLTTPAPPPKAVVQASAPPRPRVEGPS